MKPKNRKNNLQIIKKLINHQIKTFQKFCHKKLIRIKEKIRNSNQIKRIKANKQKSRKEKMNNSITKKIVKMIYSKCL